jgi:enoyl-CoA hydratase
MDNESEIEFERRGRIGLVTLNRPSALNALTSGMVQAFHAQLAAWRDDDDVAAVVVRGRGRAFCAGGDIRRVYDAGREGPPALEFFRDEYRLNAAIKHFPKPYVSLIDGYVMGGGAGISVHGSHRVFAENAVFSMPEAGIGFFPDVGSSYFLARMPNEIGLYCGLASARLGRADSLHAGVATHAAPAADLDAIVEAIADAGDPDTALQAYRPVDVKAEVLAGVEAEIARIFANGSVETILARLDAAEGPHALFAEKTAAEIRTKSPTSLRIALRQIRAARELEFDDCIRLDYRIASEILTGHDFYEGVRAALVDKDRQPRWRPGKLAEVDPRAVEAHFLAPPEGDLELT